MGEAREGMDGEGVGIDVEEAILEVSISHRLSSSQNERGSETDVENRQMTITR